MYTRGAVTFLVSLAIVAVSKAQNQCYTPNSYPGQCISVYDCPVLINFLYARRRTGLTLNEQQFLLKSQCSSNISRPPHICYNTEDPFYKAQPTTIRPIIDPTSGAANAGNVLPDPANSRCGRDIFSRYILSGTDTKLGEFPWMALLQYKNSTGVTSLPCGGSLINNRYILTAAHCVTGEIIVLRGELISVRLGEHNLNTTEDCEIQYRDKVCSDPVQDVPVEKIIVHANYSTDDANQYHDIALIRLGQTVSFSEFIGPICLPSAEDYTQSGSNLTVVGWGRTITQRISAIKQKLKIPVVSQEICKNKFRTLRNTSIEIRDTQLCAGGEYYRDSCNGDSGGPLMSMRNGLWHADGITSFGLTPCGLVDWPAVYTRVPRYVEWIRTELEP